MLWYHDCACVDKLMTLEAELKFGVGPEADHVTNIWKALDSSPSAAKEKLK